MSTNTFWRLLLRQTVAELNAEDYPPRQSPLLHCFTLHLANVTHKELVIKSELVCPIHVAHSSLWIQPMKSLLLFSRMGRRVESGKRESGLCGRE